MNDSYARLNEYLRHRFSNERKTEKKNTNHFENKQKILFLIIRYMNRIENDRECGLLPNAFRFFFRILL